MIKLLVNTRRPDITFSRNGRIHITARVARMLSLQPGDNINIAHDHGEYLLFATHRDNTIGRHVAQCWPTKKGSRNFCANSVTLCRLLLSESNISADKAAFMVGEPICKEGNIFAPIITKLPL